MPRLHSLSIACIILFFVTVYGCSGPDQYKKPDVPEQQIQNVVTGKPIALQPAYRKLMEEGERNRALNLMRIGLNAMQLGYRQQAKEALDGALSGIERVYADNDQAVNARSMWVEEGRKIFKGEPYERVMAYYYRGLLYIWDKDYQNARACFKGGMLQDAFAEEEQNQLDFALMLYLSGWCSQRINDAYLTREAFDDLKKLRPDIQLPESRDNVLLIVETGKSPRKLSDGVGHYQLKFRRGRNFTEKNVRFSTDGKTAEDAYALEDIYWQATTRGGRQFDYILEGQAKFRQQAHMVGSALSDVASHTISASTVFGSSASELQGVGIGLGVISVIAQVASASTRAEADTRYWDNLPDAVHVAPLKLSPGRHTVSIKFLEKSGAVIEGLIKTIEIEVSGQEPTLVWVRSRQQLSSP